MSEIYKWYFAHFHLVGFQLSQEIDENKMFKYDKELKLWSGRHIPSLHNPIVSLGQVVLRACSTFGSKIAQVT